jgi:hypothetical protein
MTRASPLRIARWLLAALALPALGYLLLVNLFLAFGLPWAFKSTNTVNATVRRAWSVWPGVVHVRGLRVVFQDHNLQWSLDIERARVRLRLGELPSKIFHATEVSGSGAVFRMRHRIEPQSKNAPWVNALPPIPEFPAPAVFEARVPEPPVSDADYALWTVHLENVDVGVREAWVHFVRYSADRGGGRARGAFRLKPARTLWVGPASLTLDAGRVTLGGEELTKSLSGKISCTVHPFDVRVPDGREVLRFITTDIELEGQNATPDPVLRSFGPDSGLSLKTTPGELRISARFRRGIASEGSLVRLESPRIDSEYRGFHLDARRVVTQLLAEPGNQAEASLAFALGELTARGTKTKPAQIRGALALNASSGLDTGGEFSQIERKLQLEQVDVPDARLLDTLTKASLFRAGAASFQLDARERGGVLEGTTHAQLHKVVVGSGRTEARLDGRFEAKLFEARQGEGSGRVTLDAQLSRPRLDFSSKSEGRLALSETGRLRLLASLRRDRHGAVGSQFELASAELRVTRTSEEEWRDVARIHGLRLKGNLNQSASGKLDAKLGLRSTRLHALLGNTWLRARSDLVLTLSDFDETRESGHVESELRLSEGTAVTQGGSSCPWGTLPNAKLRLGVDFTRSSAQAKLDASIDKARFSWGDFHAGGRVALTARIDSPDRKRGVGVLDFSTHVTQAALTSGANEGAGWEAKIPELLLSGTMVASEKLSGTLSLSAKRTAARIGHTKMQTDFDAATALSAIDLRRREARFSGKFSFENARLSAGHERIEGWWANIHADSALLIARENVDLSVPFRAELRDGRPGMAILAAEGSVPSFVADSLPLRQLAVTGTVQRRCRLTNFRFTQASGGPLIGRGLLNSTSDAVRGAFLVRLDALKALSAGVEVAPSDTGVSIFAGDDWLRERTKALEDMVRRALDEPCTTPPAECSAESDSNERLESRR